MRFKNNKVYIWFSGGGFHVLATPIGKYHCHYFEEAERLAELLAKELRLSHADIYVSFGDKRELEKIVEEAACP